MQFLVSEAYSRIKKPKITQVFQLVAWWSSMKAQVWSPWSLKSVRKGWKSENLTQRGWSCENNVQFRKRLMSKKSSGNPAKHEPHLWFLNQGAGLGRTQWMHPNFLNCSWVIYIILSYNTILYQILYNTISYSKYTLTTQCRIKLAYQSYMKMDPWNLTFERGKSNLF